MASTYTLNNGIELIGTGEQSGTWGDTTNTNLELIDTALDGQISLTLSSAGSSGSPNALPVSDGASSNGRNRLISYVDSGDLGATAYVQLTPNDAEKIIYIRNALSGSRSIIVFQGTYNASNDYEIPAGTTAVVYFNGGGTGAVAANVFNNAYFDGLRLGSVSVTAILDEDNMASNSATALSTQQSIKAYVDSQVGTVDTLAEILANGNTTGGTDLAVSTGDDITFADNSKAIFGAGSDLQIYHDGANNYIEGQTGSIIIQNTLDDYNVIIKSDNGSGGMADYFRANGNTGAALMYNYGSEKLATTSTGIDVTGTAVTDGLTVAGNVSVDGGTIKLDGNYPVGTANVALGDTALDSVQSGGNYNVAIGSSAGTAITNGEANVALGWEALKTEDTGNFSTAIGYRALLTQNNNASNYNTAVGALAGSQIGTGVRNTIIGGIAGDALTNANYNVAIGFDALGTDTLGSGSVAIGYQALERQNFTSATTNYNVAVGYNTGENITTGVQNTLIGALAGDSLTDADLICRTVRKLLFVLLF